MTRERSERERFHLRGAVRILESQFAKVDPLTSDWAPPRLGPTFAFDRAGHLEGRPASQDVTQTTYDERGLRTTIGPQPPDIPRLHGMEYGIGIDRPHVDVLTRYDAQDRPVEINFRDEAQNVQRRLVITRDDQGRIVREQVFVDMSAFVGSANAEAASLEDRKEFERGFNALMPDGIVSVTEYAYDELGRVAQTVNSMGSLSQNTVHISTTTAAIRSRSTISLNQRDANIDEQGEPVFTNESSSESWTRHEYRYDDHGNWLERVTSTRQAPDADFHRSTIERRTITYFT
jgi:YD repeat-containing protein